MKRAGVFQAASITGLLLFGGCLSADRRTSLSTDHPANPQAQEVPFTMPPDLLAQPVNPTPAATPVAGEGEVYTCPMHPQVREHAPGKCPRCGMTLEPSVPTEKHGNDHAHEPEAGE